MLCMYSKNLLNLRITKINPMRIKVNSFIYPTRLANDLKIKLTSVCLKGKMYQCIKFSAFNSGMMKSKRNLSSEEEDEEFKHALEGKLVFTKVDIMLRPSNNKSFVFISPFLLNDD